MVTRHTINLSVNVDVKLNLSICSSFMAFSDSEEVSAKITAFHRIIEWIRLEGIFKII